MQVEGPEAEGWKAAASELEAELAAQRISSTCRLITLFASHGRAQLVFSTQEGRSAERVLDEPIELVPTIQALSVALLPAKPEPKSEPATIQTTPAAQAPPPAAKSAPSLSNEAGPNPYALFPLFGVSVGFRTGAGRLISPTAGGSLAIAIAPWELGMFARIEAHYVDPTGQTANRPDASGVALGLNFGPRMSAGRLVIRAGGSLMLAALREDGGDEFGRAEVRLGVYLGIVYPSQSKLRFRLELAPELVPYNMNRSQQNDAGEWSLPWWAVGLAAGAEFG